MKKNNNLKHNEIQVFYLHGSTKKMRCEKIYCVDGQFFRSFIVTVMLCSLLENEK